MLDLTEAAAPLTGVPCVTAEATAVSAVTAATAGQLTQTRTRVTAHAPAEPAACARQASSVFSYRHHQKGARPLNVTACTRNANGNDRRVLSPTRKQPARAPGKQARLQSLVCLRISRR